MYPDNVVLPDSVVVLDIVVVLVRVVVPVIDVVFGNNNVVPVKSIRSNLYAVFAADFTEGIYFLFFFYLLPSDDDDTGTARSTI